MRIQYFVRIIIIFFLSILVVLAQAQELPEPTTLDIAWHPIQDWVAVADTDGLRLLDATDGTILQTFSVQSTAVYAVAWSSDGSRLASGGDNGVLEIWNPNNGQQLANLQGHVNIVNALAWSDDDSLLASTNSDFGGASLRTWDMVTYQAIAERESGFITSLVWSHYNQQLFVTQRNGGGTIAIDAQLTRVSPLTYDIDPNISFDGISIDLHPTSNILVAGAVNGDIHIVDTDTDQTLMTLTDHTDIVTDVEWSSDGSLIVSASADGTIKIWDGNTGQPLDDIMQSNILYAVAFSPDSTQIAYGGENIGGSRSSIPIVDVPSNFQSNTCSHIYTNHR